MIRSLTYCRRFIFCCKNKVKITENLTTEELENTLMTVVRIVQNESFSEEIRQLSNGQTMSRSSKLLSLAPFLDKNGIIRVGGRLDKSQLPYSEKHQIILPRGHHFTTLVIRDAHMKTLHGGNQLTQAYIRRKYWILDARTAVRQIIHQCLICCRHRGETVRQLMGTLPSPRVTPSKPFTHTGVDYAGPFNIRVSPGRGTKSYKGYIAVFVCFSTKAIHLEVVSDMTTNAFLAAFKRFIARRSFYSDIYSDCGTTFVGAKNEFDKIVKKNHMEASNQITTYGTQWHFIPPAAPHFGGLWEAGVKSVKYHLYRIARELVFTYEEFSTLLCQIEACLNSRPLCPLSNEPNDLAVITPGHFLTGSAMVMPAEITPPEKPIHCLKRLELISKLKNDFWKIWSTEYLSRLQQRPKWTKVKDNIQEGSLVLITDEVTSPTRWPLGRVVKLYPGQDGLIRVVHIKTANKILERPITKLCRLPFETEDVPSADNHNQAETMAAPNDSIKITRHKRKRGYVNIHPTSIPPRPSIEELKRSCLPKKKSKNTTISTVATSLLLLNLVMPIFTNPIPNVNVGQLSTVEVEEFRHNPGIYFEDLGNLHMVNNEWNTIVYYNMSTYYQQLNGFKLCLDKLTSLCNQTVTFNYYCRAVLTEISHKMEVIEENNLILHHRNGYNLKDRKRRAPLEFIGALQHSLFGVLDQSSADYIQEEINKLKENEGYLLNLARNQTSITEVTANILKKTSAEIEEQFKAFNEYMRLNNDVINRRIDENTLSQSFTSTISYLNLMLHTYEDMQEELINLVLDMHDGKISPLLLTPVQLKEEVRFIRQHISSNLIIPGEVSSEDILNLYKIITVKSRITEDNIIFKIRIPLPTEDLYQLFKIYPVPTQHGSNFIFIEPSSEFIATTLHRDYVYPLTKNEIKECVKTESLGLLCRQQHPVYSTNSLMNRCEMELLNHKGLHPEFCNIKKAPPSSYWIQLEHHNSWIYTVHEDITVNIVCGTNVMSQTLKTSGIIKLSEGCTIKHHSMSITAQSTFTEQKNSSFLPSKNISAALPELQIKDHTIKNAPLIHLDTAALNSIKLNVKDNLDTSINNHHIHHYISTYLIVIIIIAVVLWLLYQRFQPCKKERTTSFDISPVTPQPAKRSTKLARENDQSDQ